MKKANYQVAVGLAISVRSGSRARGLTLVEVVAALALLGTLLVASMMAYGRHVRQVRLGQDRVTALKALDQLLVQWRQTGYPEHGAHGHLSDETLEWKTTRRSTPETEPLAAEIVRIEVFRGVDPVPTAVPVAMLELLAPRPIPLVTQKTK